VIHRDALGSLRHDRTRRRGTHAERRGCRPPWPPRAPSARASPPARLHQALAHPERPAVVQVERGGRRPGDGGAAVTCRRWPSSGTRRSSTEGTAAPACSGGPRWRPRRTTSSPSARRACTTRQAPAVRRCAAGRAGSGCEPAEVLQRRGTRYGPTPDTWNVSAVRARCTRIGATPAKLTMSDGPRPGRVPPRRRVDRVPPAPSTCAAARRQARGPRPRPSGSRWPGRWRSGRYAGALCWDERESRLMAEIIPPCQACYAAVVSVPPPHHAMQFDLRPSHLPRRDLGATGARSSSCCALQRPAGYQPPRRGARRSTVRPGACQGLRAGRAPRPSAIVSSEEQVRGGGAPAG